MQISFDQLFRAAVIVVVGGLLILAFTYLAEFLIPLIAIAVAILIIYFAYKYLTSGQFKL